MNGISRMLGGYCYHGREHGKKAKLWGTAKC